MKKLSMRLLAASMAFAALLMCAVWVGVKLIFPSAESVPTEPRESEPPYDYRILTLGSLGGKHWGAFEFIDDESLIENSFSSEVCDRDYEAEQELNVEIRYIEKNNIYDYVRQSALAGTDDYDLVSLPMQEAGRLTTEGLLTDLREYDEYLHLDEECWDQNIIRDLDLSGSLYFATGDLTLLDKQATVVTYVNDDMLRVYPELLEGYESIYSMVDEGRWTIERMLNMVKAASRDVDGDGEMTYRDAYGHSGDSYNLYVLLRGCGLRYFDRDDGGELRCVLSESAPDILSAYEYADEIVNNEDYSILSSRMMQYVNDVFWEGFGGLFEKRQLLFNISTLNRVHIYRDWECDLGIIPVPKLSEDQSEYGMTMTGAANCVAIPTNVNDKEQSARVLYALMKAAGDTTYHAYVERCLTNEYGVDEDSRPMLQLIFDSRTVDIKDVFMSTNIFIDPEDIRESSLEKEASRAEKMLERFLSEMEGVRQQTD
ncbi:MAG: extracellular solute-binding protein [Clostridia bacterium]|nr:extracellular solute-binding protein [Clostridia bacterium]